MSLNPSQMKRLKDAFNETVNNLPDPDAVVLHAGSRQLSAKELAKEIDNETPIGKYFIALVDDLVSSGAMSFDSVINQMTSPKPPKP
jgi:hypothetical protein